MQKKEIARDEKFLVEARKATAQKVQVHQFVNFSDKPNEKIKVSAVVPVCNVADFLPECLESIQNQTMQDFEAICVNDGSTDESLDILLEFAKKDSRFKVIDKENAGYGHAMNIGMDHAQGEFIAIVESDDWIRPRMFETLYATAEENQLDFVKSDFYRFTSEELATRLFYHPLANTTDLYGTVLHSLDDIRLFKFSNTWTGIYRRSFLENRGIRHQETPGASYQDNGFWFQTTCSADRFMYLEEPFYMNRRDNPNSSVFNNKKLYAGNSEFKFCEEYLNRHPDLYEDFIGYLIKKKLDTYHYNFIRVSPELKLEYIRECSREMALAFALSQVDESLFSSGDLKKLRDIATDPLGFHERNKHGRLAQFDGKSANDAIPIALITDNNYAMPAGVAISSLSHSKQSGTRYHVVVIGLELSDFNIKKLASLHSSTVNVEILQLNPEVGNNFATESLTTFGVPSTALVKFLLPSLLPHQKKVIYLDDDVLVRQDLRQLYEIELGDNFAGVVPDMPQVLYETQAFGAQYGRDYFNSGALLLNLKKMREEDTQTLLIETKKTLESPLQDQDVFNHVFGSDVVILPVKFNTLLVNLVRSEGRYSIQEINNRFGTHYQSIEDIRHDSVVVHFCSKDKPWKYYDVPMADEWLASFQKSPFSEIELVRTSVHNRPVDVVSNGFYSVPDGDLPGINIALWADRANITSVAYYVNKMKTSGHDSRQVGVHVLHQSLQEEDLDRLAELTDEAIIVQAYDVSRLVREHAEISELPRSSFFKLLVPEVLFHLPQVLVISGAKMEGPIRDFDAKLADSDDLAIAPLSNGNRRFFDSAALLFKPRRLVELGVKQRYVSLLGKTRKQGPTTVIHETLKTIRVVDLHGDALSFEAHNAGVAAQDSFDQLSAQTKLLKAALAKPAAAKMSGTKSYMRKKDRTFEDGVAHVRNSVSYKIGNTIVAGPSKVKKIILKRFLKMKK